MGIFQIAFFNEFTVTKPMNKPYMIYMYIDANELWYFLLYLAGINCLILALIIVVEFLNKILVQKCF